MTNQEHITATRWLNETYARMRQSEVLEGTVITWGPGWTFAGMRSRVEQDDGEASLAVHEIDFGDSVASLDIAHIYASPQYESTATTVGIELTAGDVRLLAARLTEIASRFCVECDRNLNQTHTAECPIAIAQDHDDGDHSGCDHSEEDGPCFGIHNFVLDTGADPIFGSAHCTECRCEKIDPMPDNYTPGTWRHTDWCHTPTGHPGDCWKENDRVLGLTPGPAMVIVDATTGERTEIY